jgi:hypothetical protein
MQGRFYLKCEGGSEILRWKNFWYSNQFSWNSYNSPSIVSDVSHPKFQNYSELQISWLKQYVSAALAQILKEPLLLQKTNDTSYESLNTQLFGARRIRHGVFMEARLLYVKKYFLGKVWRGTPKMMPHPLLSTEIQNSFISGKRHSSSLVLTNLWWMTLCKNILWKHRKI